MHARIGKGYVNPLQYSCLENPGTEEPGGLQFIGLNRVRRDSPITERNTYTVEVGHFPHHS